jgi:hypothetical protein
MATNNHRKTIDNNFTIRLLCLILLVALVITTGSMARMTVFAANNQSLPTCTDPTGQNLPCFMVISTLPPPVNAINCQESSGQILACSYSTQNLSNGQEVMVITVYVPASFVFGPGTVKVVAVHERKLTRIIREEPRGISIGVPSPVCRGIQGVHGCIVFLPGGPGQSPFPIYLTPLPPGPHTAGFRLGWFYGNTGSDYYNPYPTGSKDWLAFNLGLDQGFKASTPYTNCEHFDTCPYPTYDPTKDPKYKPQSLPTPCVSPQGIDYCSRSTINPLGLLLPSHGNSSQTELVGNHSLSSITTSPHITNASGNAKTGGKKESHAFTSCINNCTSTSHTTKVDCSTNLASCHHQQQQHTAAYLQALNSGSPNPYKPGSKDYEHYQAGIAARKQNNGDSSGSSTINNSRGTGNNNNDSSPNDSPTSGGGSNNGGKTVNNNSGGNDNSNNNGSGGSSTNGHSGESGGGTSSSN